MVTSDCYDVPDNGGPVTREIDYQLVYVSYTGQRPMNSAAGVVWEHLKGTLPVSGADSPPSDPPGTFYDTQSVVIGSSAQDLNQTFSVVLNGTGTNVGLAVFGFGGWQYELNITKRPFISINGNLGGQVKDGKLVPRTYKPC